MVQVYSATSESAPTVVVVGAGPSGLVAGMLLAKRGCQVKIFDKREPPEELPTNRTFPISLNSRALTALEAAGVKLDVIESKKPLTGFKNIKSPTTVKPMTFPSPRK